MVCGKKSYTNTANGRATQCESTADPAPTKAPVNVENNDSQNPIFIFPLQFHINSLFLQSVH
jgi:hypothetical protein